MRTFGSTIIEALDDGRIGYTGMIRFDLGEGTFGFIRRSSALEFEGVTYHPMAAGILVITDLPSTTGTSADGAVLELSESPDHGLTPDLILQIETYDYRDRPFTVYDLIVDPRTGEALADPIARARGYINAIEHVEDDARGFVARIECEGRAIDYRRTNGRIRSVTDQHRRAPGDTFLTHAGTAGRIELDWGRK